MTEMTANLTTMTIEWTEFIIIDLIYEPLKVTNQIEFLIIQNFSINYL